MQLLVRLKAKVAGWSYPVISIMAAIAAFGTYTCMYSFRKAFAAATFDGHEYLGIDYKVWLIIAQVLGYTFSKFYGIRFISEMTRKKRAPYILILIGISWLSLLGFAIIPAPWNIVFLFMNGFPLGMIWGLVFGYLEGRKSTEFMAAFMSISMIFASGFVKTVGRTLISDYSINEYLMPFATGALFAVPLLFFVFCLELIPPPTEEDKLLRTERLPMNGEERIQFLFRFLPGIFIILIIYVLLTVMRDVRDNFEVEIWADLGINSNTIYTNTDSIISLIILTMMSLLILVRDNLKAFKFIHLFIIAGFILVGFSTWLFNQNVIGPVWWMTVAGIGLYMGYVPFNAIFFERLIATFHVRGNVGFIMYVADAVGYLGSISLLLIKELGRPAIGWADFFRQGIMYVSIIGGLATVISLIYFVHAAQKSKKNLKYEFV